MAKYNIIPSSRTIVQSPISIGHKAEKGVEAIEFDLTAWVETYGSGTLTVVMQRWGDAIPYPIALEIDENNKATWTLSDTDTAKAGMAYAQLNYIVGDEVVKKSDIYTFRVMDSLTGEGEPPEAYDSWLEQLTHLAAEAMAEVLDIEGVVTDKTLTVDGGIADAKKTGDEISALKAKTLYGMKPGDDMLSRYGTFTDREHSGVTFDWTGRQCHVSGTADGDNAFVNVFNGELPYDVFPWDLFRVRYESTSTRIGVKVNFYDASGTLLSSTADSKDFEFVVPQNAKTMFIRVYVVNGITIDATLTRLQVIKMNKVTMDIPLIVSFVDDDTTANDYVTKYHDACCHNGVKGNYAVITKNIEQQRTSADKLLGYEDDGFGMLIHCYAQTYEGDSPWTPQSGIRTKAQINECRANLAKGLRQMRDLGFVNYDYWITPGGHMENDLKDMTKQLGLKCLISTNNGRENRMTDYDKCYIKRVSFSHDDTYASSSMSGIKSLIDDVASRGKGWLIITTHFNDGWSGLTWDTTLDANGYPVGYSRFNEMVQYAISKGLVPMSLPQAWEYYAPILENNRDLCNMAN